MAANTNQTNQSSPNIDVNTPYVPRRPAPLVSISVNHPFATAFRKVKNFLIHKQTLFSTTFSIKITPIVAIVSLFGLAGLFGGGITTAFSLGKTVEQKFLSSVPKPTAVPTIIVLSPTPASMLVSLAGTIKSTYQLPPDSGQASLFPTIMISNQTSSISGENTPTTKPTPTITQPTLHYILLSRSGSITYLASSSIVHLQKYVGLRVLITGMLKSTNHTLTIAKPEDIEVLQ